MLTINNLDVWLNMLSQGKKVILVGDSLIIIICLYKNIVVQYLILKIFNCGDMNLFSENRYEIENKILLY